MSGLYDLSKLAEPEECYKQQTDSLLSKYGIPIQHFEFDYISACNDGREVEKIYQVLMSGEQGYYPELMKTAEERLCKLKPKSRWLRKTCPVVNKDELNKDDLNELSNDLESWVLNISKYNKELETRKTNEVQVDAEIRTSKTVNESIAKPNEKRISSTDYSAWEKYDPDTEILKAELEEEKEKNAVLEEKKQKPKKKVTFNKFATEAEATFISDREREKGNEFFKAGDYKEALCCYTQSIASKSSVDNLNNRAATYLKLKKYELALKDCDRVLAVDKENLKGNLRKADALEKLKRFDEALECVEFVIQRDPNNNTAQELADRVRENCNRSLTNTRMKIIELE